MTHQRPLGEIAKLIRGISFPKESKSHEPRPGDVACLRTANVQRQVEWGDLWFVPAEHVKRQEQYVQPGDILISTANSYELVGKVAFVTATPHKSTLGAFISLIRPSDEVDPKFLYHQLAWRETQHRIRETASTTTNISNVSTKKLAGLELLLPSLDEQGRIVAEIEKQFSRLDEAVTNLKRVKANLQRYKAAVLKAAVEGRLVETEAELARREGRSYETGAQFLQRILETRRSQWQGKGKYKEPAAPDTTDLPELPEGWVWATLEQLCPIFVDSAHRTPKYEIAGFPAIGPRDVVGGYLRLDSARVVSEKEYSIQVARRVPQGGDIVYSRELSLGWGAIVPDGVNICLSQGMCLFRPDESVSVSYFMYSLNGPVVRNQATRGATGSAHPHLNLGDIKGMIFTLPPQAEQHRIAAEVDRRLSLLRVTETQVDANLQRAERLRQSILSRAFTGGLSLHEPHSELMDEI